MIPFLADNYPFIGNGLGGLSDAIECKVTHEINGEYELSMRYPITGIHYDEILKNYFIMAEPDNMTKAQPFRIYRISKPLNGVVTVYARHIAYDMMGTIVEPFTQSSLTAAINDLANHCTPATSFTFSTTRSVASQFKLSEPRELWRVLGGAAGSFLDVYGGEWDFNLLTAELKTRLGTDRGVHIRYGKNMTGLEQDATIESTYSGVWPFWYDADAGTLVQISEKYVAVAGAAVSDRVLLLDCTDDFETQPSEQDLRDRANSYITANSVGDPKLTWKVSFVQLAQAGETQAALEQVMLGDTLHVYYEALGVNATARAVKVTYDVLAEHYSEVTVGRVKQNLASIIVGQNRETESKIATTKSALEQAIDRSTDFIKNGAGYMRMIYNSSNELVEIVSLDNPDISQAQNVWRWNNGGFGFSNTGYNGTYGLALTQAGEIVADYITAGTLNANVIRAGLLTDAANKNSWDLSTGALTITDGTLNITTQADQTNVISLNYTDCSTTVQPYGVMVKDLANNTVNWVNRLAIGTYKKIGTAYYPQSYLSGSQLKLGGTNALAPSGGELQIYDTSQRMRSVVDSSGVSLSNSSGTTTMTIGSAYGTINIYGSPQTATISSDSIYYYNGTNKYTYLMWPDSNGAGRIILGDGTSTYWRTSLTNNGLKFHDATDTQTAEYLANPVKLINSATYTTTTAWAYSGAQITLDGGYWWLVIAQQEYNNAAPTGVAIVNDFSTTNKFLFSKVDADGFTYGRATYTSAVIRAASSFVVQAWCKANTAGVTNGVHIRAFRLQNV